MFSFLIAATLTCSNPSGFSFKTKIADSSGLPTPGSVAVVTNAGISETLYWSGDTKILAANRTSSTSPILDLNGMGAAPVLTVFQGSDEDIFAAYGGNLFIVECVEALH